MRKKMNFLIELTNDLQGKLFVEKYNIVKYLYQTNLSEIVLVHDKNSHPYILKVVDRIFMAK